MGRNGLTSLDEIHTGEISLVKRGANKKKRFPFYKSEDGMPNMQELLENVLKTEADGEETFAEVLKELKVSEKGEGAALAALRILKSFKDELPAEAFLKLQEAAGVEKAKKQKGEMEDEEDEEEMPFPNFKKKSDVKKWYESMPEELRENFVLKEADEPEEEPVNKEIEAVMKAHTEEMEAIKKENEEVRKSLEAERDARELEGWVAKAEKELSHYPGKSSQELGSMLHKLHKSDPDMAKEQFDTMKTTSETLQKSELFREAGGTSFSKSLDDGSAWSKIEKMAEGLVEKSEDLSMTKSEAIWRVMDSPRGAALYEQYLKEHPKQTHSA